MDQFFMNKDFVKTLLLYLVFFIFCVYLILSILYYVTTINKNVRLIMKKNEIEEKSQVKEGKAEKMVPKRIQTAEGKRRAMLLTLKGSRKKAA